MKKNLFLIIVTILTAAPVYAGQIQISTYYPSPFGYYERLKFNPRGVLGQPCEVGTVYYLSGTGLKYCADDTTWKNMGGSVWNQNVNDIYPIDTATNPNLKVGIGTTSPTSGLHVYAPEGYTPAGVFLDDADINVDGGPDGEFMIRNNNGIGTQKIFLGGTAGAVLTVDGVAGSVGIGTMTPNNRIEVADLIDFNNTTFLTALGYMAGDSNSTGNYNTFIGYNSGLTNTTGQYNTFVGYQSGISNVIGNSNTFLGYATGQWNTSGNNTFIGHYAGNANTTGTNNIFLGANSGRDNTTGNNNTANGTGALRYNTTGYYNTAIGDGALYSNTAGIWNTANGSQALYSNTTGGLNTASGYQALYSNTTQGGNVATGYRALYSNTTGYENTASGTQAMASNTAGYRNTATGYYALSANTIGLGNTATGYYALAASNTGSDNTANGVQALGSNTTGGYNTASGYNALSANTIGNYNTAIGYSAGINVTTGSRNIIIGSEIYAPSATASNQLSIGNLIFGTGLDGTGTTISTGNIGIGTNAPLELLHLKHTSPTLRLERTNNANRNVILFYPSGAVAAGNEVWGMGIPAAADYFTIGYDTDDIPPGTHALNINNAGNVGIGTTTPGTKLDVNGPIRPQQYAPGTSETASQAATVRVYDNVDCDQLSEEGKIVYKNDRNAGELCFCARGNAGANFHWFCLSTQSAYW